MKKIGFSAMRRIVGATIPGSDLVIDGVSEVVSRVQGDEDESIVPFQNRDADQHGAGRYGVAQSRDNDEVVEAQFLLAKLGHLKFSDIDGCIGPGTLRAIESWESQNGVNFYTGEPLSDVDPRQSAPVEGAIQGVPHLCQGDYPGLMIVPEGGGEQKPVSRIGCLSCVTEIHRAFYHGGELDINSAVNALNANAGYDKNRDLRWGAVRDLFGLSHLGDIELGDAIEHVESGTPVVVCERTQYGGTHFTIAVRRGKGGWFVVNPGRKAGDYYSDPDYEGCWKPDENVIRLDVIQPV